MVMKHPGNQMMKEKNVNKMTGYKNETEVIYTQHLIQQSFHSKPTQTTQAVPSKIRKRQTSHLY